MIAQFRLFILAKLPDQLYIAVRIFNVPVPNLQLHVTIVIRWIQIVQLIDTNVVFNERYPNDGVLMAVEVVMARRVRRQRVQRVLQQAGRGAIERGDGELALFPVLDVRGRLLVYVNHVHFQLEARQIGEGQRMERIPVGRCMEFHQQLGTAANNRGDRFAAA